MDYQIMSDTIADFAKAFVNVQASISNAKKDSNNPFFKSKYADLESIILSSKEPLAANGFSYSQTMLPGEKTLLVTTLLHCSGQWMRSFLPIHCIKKETEEYMVDGIKNKRHIETISLDPQVQGSSITYARRYALAAILGITQTDDDGNHASGIKTESDSTQGTINSPSSFFKECDVCKKNNVTESQWRWSKKMFDGVSKCTQCQKVRG